MTTFNTAATIIMIIVGVSAVAAVAIAMWMGAGRSAQGGPPPGSLERDEDHDPGDPHA